MSWTDKASIEHIKKIRDIFKVKTFVETGTFLGMNVLAHKDNFKYIISCEKDKNYYNRSMNKIRNIKNIEVYNMDSVHFILQAVRSRAILFPGGGPVIDDKEPMIFYLDAHFYDPKRPKGEGKFVVLDELKELKGLKNAIIIIHDFDNNLGHITYDGVSLDISLLKKDLLRVNPNFKFYTNELSSCDIMTLDELESKYLNSDMDKDIYYDMQKNLEYAWSKPDKTYRGILYCVPKKINVEGLREIK